MYNKSRLENKLITDQDRILVGIREWAIEKASQMQRSIYPDAIWDNIVRDAKQLENYVIEGILD